MQNEDFGFYGEGEDEVKNTTVKGISDNVAGFTFTKLKFPCIIFKEGFKCPKHQLTVISNMVKTVKDLKDVNLYYQDNEDVFKMGALSGLQVDSFLEIVGDDKVVGYYDKDTKLEGSMLYTLCTV